MIGDAAVARESFDIGQTRALACGAIADVDAVDCGVGAEEVADAGRALLTQSVAEVSLLAELAGESFRVEEALLALAGAPVAVTRFRQVDVVAALAGTAAAAHLFRIAVVVVGADVAARSRVTFLQFNGKHFQVFEVIFAGVDATGV